MKKGYKLSEIAKENHRKAQLGEKNSFYGKKHSETTKKIIGENSKKISHKGQIPWNKGIKRTEEDKLKMKKPKTLTEKLLNAQRERGLKLRGKNHWNWKGGITYLNINLRNKFLYKIWRSKVFERDNWTCQTCQVRGCRLEAHHKKSFAQIIKENNITNFEEAENCLELWDLNNGVTLCSDCHDLTKFGITIERISKSRGMI